MRSLYLRLHSEGFLHQSPYPRNVVMRPGPITAPPWERSLSKPNFHLIDYGRSINVKEQVAKSVSKEGLTEDEQREKKAKAYRHWRAERTDEESRIGREFYFDSKACFSCYTGSAWGSNLL